MTSPLRLWSKHNRFSKVLLGASLGAGLVYPIVEKTIPLAAAVAVKGLGVGLLAVAALLLTSPRRWWLAAVMAAGALGDMLLNIPGLFLFGGASFALGHVIAMVFYLQNGRNTVGLAARLAAAALVGYGLAMPNLVSQPGTPVGALMLYSVLLCGMAATLLLSRFSRAALAGALLFVISDTLLTMRLSGDVVGSDNAHGLMVWLTYFFGQFLIFRGVSDTLAND
jgi:uncharacterized membrane protein YhhN